MIPGAQKNAPIATLLKTPVVVANNNPRTMTPIPQEKPTARPVTVDASGLKSSYTIAYTGKGRGFVGGNCTWYVAQNKSVTWRGNAAAWMKNARAQ
jgi:surface antigen